MDVIVNFMEADLSFAGVGAYYKNGPVKSFMGDETTLPAAVVAEALDKLQFALDKLQFGGGTHQHKMHMKEGLQPDACASTCLANVHKNCTSLLAQSSGGAADMESAQCMMEGKNLCSAMCASVSGGESHHHHRTPKGAGKGAVHVPRFYA